MLAPWNLGLGEPRAVSALHGRGSGDLLDAVLAALPDAPADVFDAAEGGPRRVALLGKPNVGKSSLLNRIAGADRVLADPVAGTTIDPGRRAGDTWRADLVVRRHRRHPPPGRPGLRGGVFRVLRTAAALDRCEVAVVLIDASEPLSEQDLRIVSMVIDAGRALVLAFNKWDLLDEDRRLTLEREVDRQLARVAWAPRVMSPRVQAGTPSGWCRRSTPRWPDGKPGFQPHG